MEGLSKKEKGLIDMANSVVIAGVGRSGTKCNRKRQYNYYIKKGITFFYFLAHSVLHLETVGS